MNKCVISGRWVKDHDLRYNQSGTAILKNTIASTRKFKNPNGDYDSDFINVVLFNQNAKFASDYSKKGDSILIEGRIQTRNYDDKDGKKVYVTEIVADSIELLNTKKKEQSNNNQINETNNSNNNLSGDPYKTFGEANGTGITDSDLPF